MIEFLRLWAFLLVPLPVLVRLAAPVLRANAVLSVPPSIWAALGVLDTRSDGGLASRAGSGLKILGWLALVVALAGPYQRGLDLVPPTGRDLMIAVDLSASMGEPLAAAPDQRQIDVVIDTLQGFLSSRHGDRVGLIGFATEAYLIAPLTFDIATAAEMLDEVTIGLPGRRTDLGQAIGQAVRAFRTLPQAERVLLIVSDGEANAGDLAAMDAAALAADAGIVIHMIGFAEKIDSRNTVLLAQIAQSTGGLYAEATDPAALAAIHDRIAAQIPVSSPDDRDQVRHDWTWLPLTLALGIALLQGWRESEMS